MAAAGPATLSAMTHTVAPTSPPVAHDANQSRVYIAALITEAIVIAVLCWLGVHFG